MKSDFQKWTVKFIIEMATSGKLHANPIGQRPPVSAGNTKSVGIITAMIIGYGISMITVRDIRDDEEMQKVYPGVHYLVIDGGHRVRAILEYHNNKFRVNGTFCIESPFNIEDIIVPVEVKVCTSPESIEIFRNVNKTTGVNPIEMIMCDDQSEICKEVRSRTSYYKEYGNTPHELFNSHYSNAKQKYICQYMANEPNHRREWDKYVFVAIHKVLGKGNVDAGEAITEALIEQEYKGNNKVTKSVLKIVDQFLDDVLSFQKYRGNTLKMSGELFSAIQLVWFGLYGKNQQFKITDMRKFHNRFMDVYGLLSSKVSDTRYNKTTIEIDGESVNIKEFFRKGSKNFANGVWQKRCEELFFAELGDDYGVTFRDEKRTISTSDREIKLAAQGYVCALDGEDLTLEESVWGHDVAWSDGGKHCEGAVIRKGHNITMGTLTFEEYKMVLQMRKNKKNALQAA